MGAAASTASGALVSGIMYILDAIRKASVRENPTFANMTASADAEEARAEAEKARAEAEAAKAEAKKAWEEVKVMRDTAEAEKRQAEEELQRQRAVLAESQRAEEHAKEWARQAQRQANESTRIAKKAQKQAEEHLKKGVQPVIVPSPEEVEAAKRRVQYKEGLFHFAVAGVAGGGKSSFINGFRGLHNRDTAAASTGVTETTLVITRLPDPNQENPFVWYDIPGAGTTKIPDWQYFNEQGLYVFDCIVVVFDSRFTEADIAILKNCERLGIPTYIVRSKSDVHIRNIMRDRGYDSEADVNRTQRNTLYPEAREKYIAETRANIKRNLEDANLPDQRVYMVSNDAILSIVKNKKLPHNFIDELELMRDVFSKAYSRRCVPTLSLATLR
ncbi:hypothetical protein PAXINDRAFT_120525 [Paxillus involutus ATCC 200175]|uniref:IRG-type G domain-containing protein n=1 Tax=Paxillus involutus ATCC 200175 TaxID=664439 RepID=A0A0C9TLI2_PAXIN|nr:hypothetical protein PAXINDRAFT_120525 [Paxillus involutus ATCC 200175]